MAGTLVIKRLTKTDLTFFDVYYKNSPSGTGKQKAINLSKNIFVDAIYPGLRQTLRTEYRVGLYIFGPGLYDEYYLTRKIILSDKNWRLNGETVDDPDNLQRFDGLAVDDLVVFELSAGNDPDIVRAWFVAQSEPQDLALFNALNTLVGSNKSDSTQLLNASSLQQIILQLSIPSSHPIHNMLFQDDLEDVALGGSQTRERIRRGTTRRKVSRQELQRTQQDAEAIGLKGEQFINEYLSTFKQNGTIADFKWTSSEDALSPYDFWIKEIDGTEVVLDVKSTQRDFTNKLHFSYSELRQAVEGSQRYDVYRVFNIQQDTALLRITSDIKTFASNILESLRSLPEGVSCDNFSFAPDLLPFNPAVIIQLSDDETEE